MSKAPGFGLAAAAAGRAGPGDVASDQGRRRASRCGARLCVSVGRRPAGSARFRRVRECARGCASCRWRAVVAKASRTHQVQSRGAHRARPGAHGELRRHGQSCREPRRARSRDAPQIFSPSPPYPPKKGGSSPIKKEGPTRIFQRENKTQACPNPARLGPRSTRQPSESSFPAGRQINK